MIRVKMTKTSDNSNDLRTNSVEGETARLPRVNECFAVTCESIDPNMDFRLVRTSVVQSVNVSTSKDGARIYQITTLNSVYDVEVLDDQD